MSARNTVRVEQVAQKFVMSSRKAIVNAANDAMHQTTRETPFKTGELRVKRRIVPRPDGALAQWFARHAAVQNLGRRRGARPFTNYTTPGTGKGFVQLFTKRFVAALKRYY